MIVRVYRQEWLAAISESGFAIRNFCLLAADCDAANANAAIWHFGFDDFGTRCHVL